MLRWCTAFPIIHVICLTFAKINLWKSKKIQQVSLPFLPFASDGPPFLVSLFLSLPQTSLAKIHTCPSMPLDGPPFLLSLSLPLLTPHHAFDREFLDLAFFCKKNYIQSLKHHISSKDQIRPCFENIAETDNLVILDLAYITQTLLWAKNKIWLWKWLNIGHILCQWQCHGSISTNNSLPNNWPLWFLSVYGRL